MHFQITDGIWLVIIGVSFFLWPSFSKKISDKLAWFGLWILKVICGVAYGFYFNQPKQKATADTWQFYEAGLQESNLLIQQPKQFFAQLFYYDYNQVGGLFSSHRSYWNNLKNTVFEKLLGIFNLLFFHSYLGLIMVENVLVVIALMQIHKQIHKHIQQLPVWFFVIFCCFPSFLFWYSGMHKDGLIFSLTALCMCWLSEMLFTNKVSKKGIGAILGYLLLLFALKNYVALAVIVAVLFIVFCKWINRYTSLTYVMASGGFLLMFVVFGIIAAIQPSLSVWQIVVNKRIDFLLLQGNTRINEAVLYPTAISFIEHIPNALQNVLFRPLLGECNSIIMLVNGVEIWLLFALFVYCFFMPTVKNINQKIWIVALAVFVILLVFIVGYTVMFTGAVIRYRALLIPFVSWYLLIKLLTNKKKWVQQFSQYFIPQKELL